MVEAVSEAVVVVDTVKEFVHGKLKIDRTQRIIPNINNLMRTTRQTGRPVVFVGDAHLPSDRRWRSGRPRQPARRSAVERDG